MTVKNPLNSIFKIDKLYYWCAFGSLFNLSNCLQLIMVDREFLQTDR